MNPTITSPSIRRSRRPLAVATLALALVLTACGGDDSDDAAGSTTTEAPADAGMGTDSGGSTDGGTDTTAVDDGIPDVDICGAITQDDMAAILPEATLIGAAPNDAIPAPTCDYSIALTGGFEAAVVQLMYAADDPAYFDGQKEIQTDVVDVPGVEDAFAFEDFGTVFVRTDTGVFTIVRGVELTEGGEPASAEQMAEIAALVAEL